MQTLILVLGNRLCTGTCQLQGRGAEFIRPTPSLPYIPIKTTNLAGHLHLWIATIPWMCPVCWGKESIHRPAPVQNFSSLQKKWGPQRKDFGGGYGFPGFYRVFVSTTGLESFSFRPEKFSKRFSFGGGCVRFFLLCVCPVEMPRLSADVLSNHTDIRLGCPGDSPPNGPRDTPKAYHQRPNSFMRSLFISVLFFRRKPKGDGGKGTGKRMSRQFATNAQAASARVLGWG